MPNKDEEIMEEVLPPAATVTAEAPQTEEDFDKDQSKVALRRQKVRELLDMGYENEQIRIILKSGVKVGDRKVKVKVTPSIISRDISYIQSENAAKDIDFSEKRAEVISKMNFLYRRAITDYMNAKGQTKNSFLNTALSVLNKIADIEGVKSPENLNVNLKGEAKVAKFAAEVHKLEENDKSTILTAIRKVLKQRDGQGTKGAGIPDEPSRIPAQAGNDEGVPRKS